MTRTWWDNEAIIRRFRAWLIENAVELPPAATADGANAVGDSTPGADQDGVLDEIPEIGLLQVVETLSAMRHELKLYTKGTRHLDATMESAVDGLREAARAFHSVQANEQEAATRAALPLVEALVGLDESLLRAGSAFQTAHRQLVASKPAELCSELDRQLAARPWWQRLILKRWHAHVRDIACDTLARTVDQEFAVLMEGFTMIQKRLARVLDDENIQRIDQVGGPADPSRMTVIELVTDEQASPETVVDVVRPGYCWNEQVVRFAEVRVVASHAV